MCRSIKLPSVFAVPVIFTNLIMAGCQTIQPITTPISKQVPSTIASYPVLVSNIPNNLQLTDGKLIFIYLTGSGENRQAKLIQTNLDGSQLKTLFKVNGTIMSLSSSQFDRRLIFTVQQGKGYPKVIMLDRNNSQIVDVSAQHTNNFSGAISPDGQHLLLSNSQTGNPEIFLTDLKGNVKQQLTSQSAIDVAPAWMPNNHSFVFTSDKNQFLHPQLYLYDLATKQILPLTNSGKSNAIARISPNGDLMSFVANDSQARLMDMDTKKITTIIKDGLAEPANFSPDGKFLIYSTQTGINITSTPRLDSGKWRKDERSYTLAFASSDSQRFTIREPIWVKD